MLWVRSGDGAADEGVILVILCRIQSTSHKFSMFVCMLLGMAIFDSKALIPHHRRQQEQRSTAKLSIDVNKFHVVIFAEQIVLEVFFSFLLGGRRVVLVDLVNIEVFDTSRA